MWWPEGADPGFDEGEFPRDRLYSQVLELWPLLINSSPIVWGIGRRRTSTGDRIVVAVDAGYDPRDVLRDAEMTRSGVSRAAAAAIRRLVAPLGRTVRPTTVPWDAVQGAFEGELRDHPLRSLSRILRTPSTVELLFLEPPRPASALRIGPEATGRNALGTLGPRLLCDVRGPLVLTAGHVFPGWDRDRMMTARIFEPGWLRMRDAGRARVDFSIEPKRGNEGYDYALASADSISVRFEAMEDVVGPPHVPINRECVIRRGKGPSRQGYVTDTVLDLMRGRTVSDTEWARCWLVAGRGGFAGEEGDSGSAVVLDNKVLLGHLVAVSGWPFGKPEMCFVQDAWSVLRHARRAFCSCLRFG